MNDSPLHRAWALIAVMGLLAAGLLPGVAHGQDEKDLREVRVLVGEGSDFFRAGKYEEAIKAFRQAMSIYQDPNLVWNLGRSYEEIGDAANASHYFRVLIERYPKSKLVAKAEERIAKMSKSLPGSLTVDCQGLAAKLVLDGEERIHCGKKVAHLLPGVHVVVASAPGYEEQRHEVVVVAKETITLSVTLEPAKEPASEAPVPEVVADPVDPPPAPAPAQPPAEVPLTKPAAAEAGWTTASLAAHGAGAILAGVSLFALTKVITANADAEHAKEDYEEMGRIHLIDRPKSFEEALGDYGDQEQAAADFDAARSRANEWRNIALVTGGVAAVAVGIGTYLYLDPGADVHAGIVPVVDGGGLVWLRWSMDP